MEKYEKRNIFISFLFDENNKWKEEFEELLKEFEIKYNFHAKNEQ